MNGYLTESRAEIENTDELPILSEEAVRELETALPKTENSDEDGLAASVESLRAVLDEAAGRWSALEAKLEAQDHQIAELRRLLCRRQSGPPDAAASASKPARESTIADDDPPIAEPSLLEKVAALEQYIAGRADRWREMEQDLESKTQRVAELETELTQRISRERNLEDRLQAEDGRSEALRDRLRRLNRQLESEPGRR